MRKKRVKKKKTQEKLPRNLKQLGGARYKELGFPIKECQMFELNHRIKQKQHSKSSTKDYNLFQSR